MNPKRDSTLKDLKRAVASLKRELAKRTAERDRAQRSLEESDAHLRDRDEHFRLITQAVAEGIYDWDIESNVLTPSARLIEIFGFRGRELTAGDWNELVHREDFERYRSVLRDCFKGITERLDCRISNSSQRR